MSFLILLITLVLLLLGVPLFVVIGIATALCFWLLEGTPLVIMAQQMFTTSDSFPLIAIPFFMLAGAIMISGGIARRLVNLARSLVSWLPGGLGVTTILACMFFAAISGSSPVTVAAIGMIMFPALIQEHYDERYALGVMTSAGSLGILIPPSIPMIIYGVAVGVSVNKLFIAGILPGVLIGFLLIGYTLFVHRHATELRTPFHLPDVMRHMRQGVWAILLPFVILGGIYSGIFTATEAAAVAVVSAFLVELLIHKELKLKKLPGVFVESAMNLGTILIIIALAKSFSQFLTIQMVSNDIPGLIQSHLTTKWIFLLAVNLVLLAAGCVMDIISAILIFAPLMAPIAKSMGIDPVHLGIIFIVNLEIGYLTPPIGINLFVSSIVFEKPIFRVIRAVFPFLLVFLGALLAITYFPQISLFLVKLYKGM